MSAPKHGNHHAMIQDLPLRNPSAVKGGSTLTSAVSDAVKAIGSALQTGARG